MQEKITVYASSRSRDHRGYGWDDKAAFIIFHTEQAAKEFADSAGVSIVAIPAVRFPDGSVYQINPNPLTVVESADEDMKQRALAKLTDGELRVLGIVGEENCGPLGRV